MVAERVGRTCENGGSTLRLENRQRLLRTPDRLQEVCEIVGRIHTVNDQCDRVDHEPQAALRVPLPKKCRPVGGGPGPQQKVRIPEGTRAAEAAIDVGGNAQQDLNQHVLVGGHRVATLTQFLQTLAVKDIVRGESQSGQSPESPVQVD